MTRIRRNPQVIADDVEGVKMLCHTGFVEFFRLNSTGARIWEICEGCDLDAVVRRLTEYYPDADHTYLAEEAQRFIGSLEEAGLIEIK